MMRTVLLLCGLLSVGCDAFREEVPGLFASAPSDPSRQPVVSSSAPEPHQRAPQLVRQLEAKFKPPAVPALTKSQECSSAPALDSEASHASRVVLVHVDARTQTKNLISRHVSERLESGELGLLAAALDGNSDDHGQPRHRGVPRAAVTLISDDLGRIQGQRYLGVFYITEYQGPALILRVGKLRREWFEGHLRAKFVLFDTEPLRLICGTELYVKNDVKSAPIRSRLQSETRGRLERELGDALRAAAERNLGSLSPQLEWPDAAALRGR